ncbi:MAG: hypothetical protein HLUCCA04_09985 [Oceanicaulis sp. HLUCCA04]|nr:MAG: hypothetical protein HLUCCA04_09985 [Oceanicaulis sp. HLUCCA04]
MKKFTSIVVLAGAALCLGAPATLAQEIEPTPVFVFDVERVALQDEGNIRSIHDRLVVEARDYCGGIVAAESVEYPVCVEAMVTHVVDELDHPALTEAHEAAIRAQSGRWQAVAYNAG